MSTFDPDVFLSGEISGSNEVKYTPVPIGEYQAFIGDIAMDSWENQPILVLTYNLIDDALKAQLGLEQPTVQDRLFLDLDDAGNIAFGPNKNVKLGRTREAVGQNDPKKKWSPNMLRGAGPVMIKVDHGYKKSTGEGPFANITRVAKAA